MCLQLQLHLGSRMRVLHSRGTAHPICELGVGSSLLNSSIFRQPLTSSMIVFTSSLTCLLVQTQFIDLIHDSHEIAILEFPTSDCSQNEAWCHAKQTDVTEPIENTWQWPIQHCKFNALVARIDDHSIVFNYAVWARCHHTVLNWLAILSERFVWCLKMTFNTRHQWKRGAHAHAGRRRVGCTQCHEIPHKISFCVNTAVSRKMWLK